MDGIKMKVWIQYGFIVWNEDESDVWIDYLRDINFRGIGACWMVLK